MHRLNCNRMRITSTATEDNTYDHAMMSGVPPTSIERVEAPVTTKAYLMCAFASIAGMLFDYNYASWQKGLVVSILSAGTFFGALISGALADWYGRRTTIIAGCGIFLAGVTVQVGGANISALVVGRLVAGFGVGFVSAVNILYMSEVAPRRVRGAIVSCYQFAITLGIMLASCVTYGTRNMSNTGAFRIPIAMQYPWAIILAAGLFLLPESPRYFVKKGRLDRAIEALSRVRGQPTDSDWLQDELAEIQANYEYEQQVGEVSWLGCFSGGIRKRNSNVRKVFIGTSLQMFQQFTGINFVFHYNTTFFKQIGLSNAFLISMITTIVNVCSTPISFYTIERYGRRPLLIYGALATSVCEFVIAAVWTADSSSSAANYVLIVFVCLYVFFFASTWGPGAWVVVGEIFQLPIRAKGIALSTASNWFWNCIIGIMIPYMVDQDEGDLRGKVFFVWGSTCALCAIFAYLFVPETKGLTLEQVDKMMEETKPIRSSKWKAHDTFVHEMTVPRIRTALPFERVDVKDGKDVT